MKDKIDTNNPFGFSANELIGTNEMDRIEEHVSNLNMVNYQIAELKRVKEEIEKQIIRITRRAQYDDSGEICSIEREGNHQHQIGKYKVRIKTEYIHSLDKEEYEIYREFLPKNLNPVKESVKYEIPKEALRNVRKYGSREDLVTLSKFIETRFAKPSITILANT